MLLHVLRHVEADQRRLIAEEELGERLGELGLPDARRAEEDERTGRPLRVFQAGTGAADRLGDRLDGVFLTDDPLVQLVFHSQELCGLLFGQLVDRDTGPQREDLGDRFFVDFVEQVETDGLASRLHRLPASKEFFFLVAQTAAFFELLAFDRFLLLRTTSAISASSLFVLRRGLHALDAQTRAGLVDQVDRLVGQDAIGDVAIGEVGRSTSA